MRPRKRILIALLGIVVVGIVVWVLAPREPSHQGKALSYWLRSLDKSPMEFQSDGLVVVTNHPAAQAFLHMGADAVPHLVRELRVRDSALKIKIAQWLGTQSIIGIDLSPAYVRHRRAINACFALGPTAKAAIPELTARLNERRISQTTRTFALAAMGPDALPAVISALTNNDPEVRLYTAIACRGVSYDAEAAVPALITCLSDPQDYRIRHQAALALAHIGKRSDLVEPALIKNLNDPNPTVRDLTADALARFRRASGKTP